MLKDLISLASHLDSKGLTKEADYIDLIIKKFSSRIPRSAHNSNNAKNKDIIQKIRTEFGNKRAARYIEEILRASDKIQVVTDEESEGGNGGEKYVRFDFIFYPYDTFIISDPWERIHFKIWGWEVDEFGTAIGQGFDVDKEDELLNRVLSEIDLKEQEDYVRYSEISRFNGKHLSLRLSIKNMKFSNDKYDPYDRDGDGIDDKYLWPDPDGGW